MKQNKHRKAYTLLEVVSAGVLVGVVIVPTLNLFRDSMETSEKVEISNAMATLGVGILESQLAESVATFTPGVDTGDFQTEGYAEVHFTARRSDQSGDGGVPGKLMAVTVDVWRDLDGNDVQDASEPSYLFASKVAASVR